MRAKNYLRCLRLKNEASKIMMKTGRGIAHIAIGAHKIHCDKIALSLLKIAYYRFMQVGIKWARDVENDIDDILNEMIKEGFDVRITN